MTLWPLIRRLTPERDYRQDPNWKFLELRRGLTPNSQTHDVYLKLFGYGAQTGGLIERDAARESASGVSERWAPFLEMKALVSERDILWGCDMYSLAFAIERTRLERLDLSALFGGLYAS